MSTSNIATVTITILAQKPYVVGQYLRAYFGADTPLDIWIRGEEGPLNLATDDLTVEFTWPWQSQLSIPATGDVEGHVRFTVTQAMLWSTWGNDYGIARAQFRTQRSLIRVISATRGVLALANLEIA